MRNLIQSIIGLGTSNTLDLIEQRRTRLLNSFCMIGLVLVVFFTLLNIYFQTYYQALLVSLGLPILVSPPILFNYFDKIKLARAFFVLSALVFINATGYYSVFNFIGRDNEILFIGFSTLIIVLYDNPEKRWLFLLTVLSAFAMKTIRELQTDTAIDLNFVFALGNMAASFLCIYFFTTLYKSDLINHMGELRKSNTTLDEQKNQILAQHDELEASRNQLKTLFDNVPIYLAMFDLEGRYKLFNSWYLKAFPNESKESMIGKRYDEAMNPELAAVSKYPIEKAANGKSVKFNKEILLPNGEMAQVYGKYVPLYNHKNVVNEILVYATDVTKLAAVEKQLKESNQVKDRLFSIISHDLRSPINNLRSMLNLPQNLDQETFELFVSQIKNQVGTVSFTMENLLSWVQTQFDQVSVSPQQVAVLPVIDNCIDLYEQRIVQKNISIVKDLEKKNKAFVDSDHLSLVCRNLIDNAVKFTPENGKVIVSFDNFHDHNTLTIADTGVGISNDKIETILSGQPNQSTNGTSGEKGSGLGLAFCKDILKVNNVKMEINSVVNSGTMFKLVFPLEHRLNGVN